MRFVITKLSYAIILASIFCISPVHSGEQILHRIAFGSCARQMQELPILNTIVRAKPDLFLMIGDSVYPDIDDETLSVIKPWPNENSVERMKDVFDQLAAKPGFQNLKRNVPIMAVWDDHDYGVNDGAADFSLKTFSQQLFLNFFEEARDSERRKTPGIYDAKVFGPEGKRVQILLLDTRYFRSTPLRDTRSDEEKKALNIDGKYAPNDDPHATVLGDVQWTWLEEQLRKPAEVRLLVSSYPLVPYELGRDAWGNFPLERKRLFDLIKDTKANGIIVLSGDVHFSEISKTDEGPYSIFELTSSPLAAPSTGKDRFKNSFRISDVYTEHNFGLIEIDWETKRPPLVNLKIIGVDGGSVITHQVDTNALHVP